MGKTIRKKNKYELEKEVFDKYFSSKGKRYSTKVKRSKKNYDRQKGKSIPGEQEEEDYY